MSRAAAAAAVDFTLYMTVSRQYLKKSRHGACYAAPCFVLIINKNPLPDI